LEQKRVNEAELKEVKIRANQMRLEMLETTVEGSIKSVVLAVGPVTNVQEESLLGLY